MVVVVNGVVVVHVVVVAISVVDTRNILEDWYLFKSKSEIEA